MTAQACRNVVRDLWSAPDPKTHHSQWLDEQQKPAHPGLLLSRYLRVPVKDDSHPFARDDVFTLAKAALKSSKALYQPAYRRWEANIKMRSSVAEVHFPQRLVIGLGSESPLETGLRLHHTYGVPFLPGAALKGLAAHYCDQVWGHENEEFKRKGVKDRDEDGNEYLRQGKYHRFLFGINDDSGHIVFHDAWIMPDSLEKQGLVLDVMTPHHQDYYAGKDNVPADGDNPTPIGFLAVTGRFLLAVDCEGENGDIQKKQCEDLVLALLKQALTHWGIGGKTSSGYGRLFPCQQPSGLEAGKETWSNARLKWAANNSALQATGGPANETTRIILLQPGDKDKMLAGLDVAARTKLLEKKKEIFATVVVERFGNSLTILQVM